MLETNKNCEKWLDEVHDKDEFILYEEYMQWQVTDKCIQFANRDILNCDEENFFVVEVYLHDDKVEVLYKKEKKSEFYSHSIPCDLIVKSINAYLYWRWLLYVMKDNFRVNKFLSNEYRKTLDEGC